MEDYKPMVVQEIEHKPIITDSYELHHGDSLKILTDIADEKKEEESSQEGEKDENKKEIKIKLN